MALQAWRLEEELSMTRHCVEHRAACGDYLRVNISGQFRTTVNPDDNAVASDGTLIKNRRPSALASIET